MDTCCNQDLPTKDEVKRIKGIAGMSKVTALNFGQSGADSSFMQSEHVCYSRFLDLSSRLWRQQHIRYPALYLKNPFITCGLVVDNGPAYTAEQ